MAQASSKEMAIAGSTLVQTSENVPLLDFFHDSTLIGHGAMVKAAGKIYIMTALHVYSSATSMQAKVNGTTTAFTIDFLEQKGRLVCDAKWDTCFLELASGAHANFGTTALKLMVPTTRQIIYTFCRTEKGLMMSKGGILWDREFGSLHTASTHPGFSGTPILTRIGAGQFGVVGIHLGASSNPKQDSNRFAPVGLLAYKTLADVYSPLNESPQLYRKDIREWDDGEEEESDAYDHVYETEDHDYFIGDSKVGRRGHKSHKSKRHAQVNHDDADLGNDESRPLNGPGQTSSLAVNGKTQEKLPMKQKAPELKTPATTVSAQKPKIAPTTAPKTSPKNTKTTAKAGAKTQAKAKAKVQPKTSPKSMPKEKAKQAPQPTTLSRGQKKKARLRQKKMAHQAVIQTDGLQLGPTSSGHPITSTGASYNKPTSVEPTSKNSTNLRESRATKKISSEAACADFGAQLQQLLPLMFRTLSRSCQTDLLNSLTQASKSNPGAIEKRSQAGPSSGGHAMLSQD